MSNYYVYIMASKRNGTLYIGVSGDLKRRVFEHRNKIIKGFTEKYNVTGLVHFEHFEDKWAAANRERMLKNWKRQWKIDLIEKDNPDWKDLYETIHGS